MTSPITKSTAFDFFLQGSIMNSCCIATFCTKILNFFENDLHLTRHSRPSGPSSLRPVQWPLQLNAGENHRRKTHYGALILMKHAEIDKDTMQVSTREMMNTSQSSSSVSIGWSSLASVPTRLHLLSVLRDNHNTFIETHVLIPVDILEA